MCVHVCASVRACVCVCWSWSKWSSDTYPCCHRNKKVWHRHHSKPTICTYNLIKTICTCSDTLGTSSSEGSVFFSLLWCFCNPLCYLFTPQPADFLTQTKRTCVSQVKWIILDQFCSYLRVLIAFFSFNLKLVNFSCSKPHINSRKVGYLFAKIKHFLTHCWQSLNDVHIFKKRNVIV